MPTILVPTDFSPTSARALQFAAQFAEATDFQLHVVHIYDGYDNEDTILQLKGRPEAQGIAERKMNEFLHRDNSMIAARGGRGQDTLSLIRSGVIIGTPSARIIELAENPETALIIMGGVGSGAHIGRPLLSGSVARAVALRSSCAVLLVPEEYDGNQIETISLAFDGTEDLKQIVRGMNPLRHGMDALMRLVHVGREHTSEEFRQVVQPLSLLNENGLEDCPIDFVASSSLDEGLHFYIQEHGIDLLVMGRHCRSFPERLFIEPSVKAMLPFLSIPLLIVPISNASN